MRAVKLTAALLLLTINSLHAARKKQNVQYIINICDIKTRDSSMHCYCEFNPDLNKANKAECWIFNGDMNITNSLWYYFKLQSNLETLEFNIRGNGALTFVPIGALKHLKHLKHLSIKFGSISKIEEYTFVNITSVEEIFLTKNEINVIKEFAFYNMSNLIMLTLEENNIRLVQKDAFFRLPALQKLVLTSNNITTIDNNAFIHLFNLLELKLNQNNISNLNKDHFNGLANLHRLDLSRNKLAELKSFTFVELWNLQDLLLNYNEIDTLEERSFDGLSQLKKLSISHNKLQIIPERLFEGVRGLTALDLRNNKLTHFTINDLKPIYNNMKLQQSYIYLEGNDFNCDCQLVWMYRLRHEAKNIKLKTSLETFVCKFISDLDNFETGLKEIDFNDELHEDKNHIYEPKRVKTENERILLQIPSKCLPCPPYTPPTTKKPKIVPAQVEANDYENLIPAKPTVSCSISVSTTVFAFLFLLLTIYINFNALIHA